MIYYPLSELMLAGIRDVLIITTSEDESNFIKLLRDGNQWGIHLKYIVQQSRDGLTQAFMLSKEFICDDNVCLMLGDNIFYGHGFTKLLAHAIKAVQKESKASVFVYHVHAPERYGVCSFDAAGNVTTIEEKPVQPKSNFIEIGLYFYLN